MSWTWRMLKRPFFGPYMRPWQWPEGVSPDEWEPLRFPNASGASLAGLWARSTAPATRGVVVIPHPMVAEAKAWAMRSGHARFLREAGFDVMVFDYNGFGESEDGRLEYPDDILAAGNAAKARMPGQPVILYGVSMGAGYGLCALDSSTHPYDAAVIESAFTSLEEFWRRFRVPYLVLRTLGWFLPRLAGQLRPIDRIGRITGLGGILFIYGSEDSLTPPSMGERLRAASRLPPERLDLWVVPGARHLKAFSAAGGEYPRRVLGFLDSVVGAA